MANLSSIRSKAEFIGALNPKAWDALKPHTPFVFSDPHVELMVADAVKSVGAVLADRNLGKKAFELSRQMAAQATSSMVSAWNPDDDICPPWPWPWPGPWPWTRFSEILGPLPDPWKPIGAAEQIELAHVLTRLSALTTSEEFNRSLRGLAVEVARGAASTVADEFERCGTVPRKPFPRPRG
jgi:hypothetical protein